MKGRQDSQDTVAALINVCRGVFEARGLRYSRVALARIFEVNPSTFASICDGRQRLSIDNLQVWLERWGARGWPHIGAIVSEKGIWVFLESDAEAKARSAAALRA